jgi:hypothetical protein
MGHPDYAETETRFKSETASHKMTILQDSGLYRHLRFMNPKDSAYWFDLITTPNTLIFRGDGESFVFSRVPDMFKFFRSGLWPDGAIRINPHYWSEKLTSERDAATRYSQEMFTKLVADALADFEESIPGATEAWNEHIDAFTLEDEGDALRALHEFSFGAHYKATCSCREATRTEYRSDAYQWARQHKASHPGEHEISFRYDCGVSFGDVEPHEIRGHYWWFLWACYGICWGIRQYDEHRRREAELLLAALPAGRKQTARRRKAARRHHAAANRRTVDRELMALIRREQAGEKVGARRG